MKIGFDHAVPNGKWETLDGKIGVGNTGVVDEDVEALESAAEGAKQVIDGIGGTDVAGLG